MYSDDERKGTRPKELTCGLTAEALPFDLSLHPPFFWQMHASARANVCSTGKSGGRKAGVTYWKETREDMG